jgi:hypothetical protein
MSSHNFIILAKMIKLKQEMIILLRRVELSRGRIQIGKQETINRRKRITRQKLLSAGYFGLFLSILRRFSDKNLYFKRFVLLWPQNLAFRSSVSFRFLEGNCKAEPDISPPFDESLPGSTRVQLSFFVLQLQSPFSCNYVR